MISLARQDVLLAGCRADTATKAAPHFKGAVKARDESMSETGLVPSAQPGAATVMPLGRHSWVSPKD